MMNTDGIFQSKMLVVHANINSGEGNDFSQKEYPGPSWISIVEKQNLFTLRKIWTKWTQNRQLLFIWGGVCEIERHSDYVILRSIKANNPGHA